MFKGVIILCCISMDYSDASVIAALRQTNKGRQKYDRYFVEEGRTKEVVEAISSHLTQLSISPKVLPLITASTNLRSENNVNLNNCQVKQPVFKVEKPKENIDALYLNQASEKEFPLLQYEAERVKSAQELYNIKKDEYDAFTCELFRQIEQQYFNYKQKQELDALCKTAEWEELQLQELKHRREKQNHVPDANVLLSSEIPSLEAIEESTSAQNEILTAGNKETEIKHLQAENELLKEREHVQEALRLKLEEYNQTLLSGKSKIEEILNSCSQKYLSIPYTEWMNKLSEIACAFDNLVATSKTNPITQETMIVVQTVLYNLDELYKSAVADADQAKLKYAQELSLKQQQEREAAIKFQLHEKNLPIVSKSENESLAQSYTLDSPSEIKEPESCQLSSVVVMEECDVDHEKQEQEVTSNDTCREYCKIVQNLRKMEESLEPFKSNPKHKKYRLELHKAVAVNTICDASGAQLKSKIKDLISLLSGQPVESGGKYTSCKQDPLALSYCKNLLAEKLVIKGEEQVQSRAAAAFPFAVVAVVLSSKFPDLWELILGHFYIRCPYLVPYYPQREPGQSDADYYVSLGYIYNDGKLEETTNFLKRMHGFATLYGAILQTDPPPGFPGKQSHGIEHGWMWMARVLNMDPRPDVTATLLLAILDVVGHSLAKHYDRQFKKLLYILCKDYFQKIKQIADTGGPVGRLKDYLHSAIRKGRLLPPEGILPSQFWRT